MRKTLLLLIFILNISVSFSQKNGHPYGDDGLFDKSLHRITPQFVTNNKYNKNTFTYCFVNYTNKLSQVKTREIIASSFEQWQKASGGYFTFTYTTSSSADFKISFVTGNHGDGYSFDGSGGVLAHAFYPPPNGGSYAGQLHFDDDENWTDTDSYGFNLFNVATHEIGHLLGLAHSNCTNATMYAYYFSGAGVLDADDIAGIRSLYGIPSSNISTYIDGPTLASCSTTYNFTARASSVLWSTSSNLSVLNQTSNSITVYPNANGGTGTITAVGSDCGNSFTTQTQIPLHESSISGPSYLCDEATYTITNLPTGATVSWDIEGWCAEVSDADGNWATISRTDYGEFKVVATIHTNCGDIVLKTGTILSGMPYLVVYSEIYCEDGCGGTELLCTDPDQYSYYHNMFTYELNETPAYPLTLHYMLLDDQANIFYQNSKTITSTSGYEYLPQNIPLASSYYNLEIWVSGGPCNESSEWYECWTEVTSCGSMKSMLAYPNPSNTELKITYVAEKMNSKNTGRKPAPLNDFNVKLLNKNGKILKEGRTTNNKEIVLQVADVPNGIYYLHIYKGKNVEKQQVVIFH